MSTVAEATEVLTPQAAGHALWLHAEHHGGNAKGQPPGQFQRALFFAIDSADPANRERLRLGFPAEVAAHWLLTQYEGGDAILTGVFQGGAR